MTSHKLVSLSVSPWSERAKWALDHHGVPYRIVEHIPIVGERRLRRLVGPHKPRATVPILVADREVFGESWEIARYADRVGKGTQLVAPEQVEEILRWQAIADEAMNAGRAIIVARTIDSDASLDENAPPVAPRWMRPLLRPVTRLAMRAFGRKYGVARIDHDWATNAMRGALTELRRALAGGQYVLGRFSYADIAMATLLQGISPVDNRFVRLGQATRRVWTHDALAAEFADLVAWRDGLYAAHRGKRAR